MQQPQLQVVYCNDKVTTMNIGAKIICPFNWNWNMQEIKSKDLHTTPLDANQIP